MVPLKKFERSIQVFVENLSAGFCRTELSCLEALAQSSLPLTNIRRQKTKFLQLMNLASNGF
jgi:hypothetical protein